MQKKDKGYRHACARTGLTIMVVVSVMTSPPAAGPCRVGLIHQWVD